MQNELEIIIGAKNSSFPSPFEYFFSHWNDILHEERSKEEKWELLCESDNSSAANKKREWVVQVAQLGGAWLL